MKTSSSPRVSSTSIICVAKMQQPAPLGADNIINEVSTPYGGNEVSTQKVESRPKGLNRTNQSNDNTHMSMHTLEFERETNGPVAQVEKPYLVRGENTEGNVHEGKQ